MDTKTSGFGIGELGRHPESSLLDDLDAAEINRANDLSCAKQCQLQARCCEDRDGTTEICNELISERVYFSGTMGCCVMCEQHWLRYHAHRTGQTPSYEAIMAYYLDVAEQERNRVKRCAVCGNHNAFYNPSAGRDLCSRHIDSY